MNQEKKAALEYLEQGADKIIEISHKIWDYAELSLKEFRSADLYIEELETAGFAVRRNLAGIRTAFCGIFACDGENPSENCAAALIKQGSNNAPDTVEWEELPRPIIGVLGEFDALSGLSQEAGFITRKPVVRGANGHGSGHNMLGAAAFGAACAIKHFLQESSQVGTIIFYGCPGEEGGAAKAFLAREHEWGHLDAAISWHPSDCNEVVSGTNNACTQVLYKYSGVAAHAVGNPEMGRSALDAVELMNTGVQYLREHMKREASVHYAIVDTGGISPNVVQAESAVLYMVRSRNVPDTVALQRRVDNIAQGAALMTDTSFESIFIDGTADLIPNTTLESIVYNNMEDLPIPDYTDEEFEFAAELRETYIPNGKLPGIGSQFDEHISAAVKDLTRNGRKAVNNFLMPFYTGNELIPGSTDVGDVSHQTPTVQFNATTFPAGAPGNSWQNTSCSNSNFGDKGMLYAARVITCSAIELFQRPELIDEAKREFFSRTDGKPYVCPIPAGVAPYVIE